MPPPRKRSPRPYPQPIRRPKVAGTTGRSGDAASDTEQTATVTQQRGFDLVTGVDLAQDDAKTEAANGADRAGAAGRGDITHVITDVGDRVDTGTDKTDATNKTDKADKTDAEDNEPKITEAAARESRKLRMAAALVLLALVLGGLAFWFSVEAADAGGDTANTALTDGATTQAVRQQVGNDLNTIMSYDYKHPDRTAGAARKLLGDDRLAADYSQIVNVLEANGVKQKLSLRTRVMTSGVEQLRGDRAVVLVLASQTYTKGGDPNPSATTARLRVNAERHGDRWRITGLKQY